MMGGIGSGRPSGCRSLDVNQLHREGCLRPGWVGTCQWTRNGERVAWIRLRAEADRLHLTYRMRIGSSVWEDMAETVRIVGVGCTLGGLRPYFICPGIVDGVVCGRRVAKLHLSGRYFLCRHCHGLGHASQGEDTLDRAFRRASTIRLRLGGEPGMAARFPPRPKGMWRRTYNRLYAEVFETEIRAEEALEVEAERRLARVDNPERRRANRRRSYWQ
jgi:hypothetical protein